MGRPTYPNAKRSESALGMDRYQLIEQIGEGGMGVVWRAHDTKTGAEVAIKIMKDISDSVCLELFTREWRTLSALSHPNIVDVRDVDVLQDDNQQKPFFVMPLLRGATLAELIRGSGERLTVARIVEIFNQVCRGLQAAHQHGLIHRDLKPSNILVMDDDTAKIIDFGIVHLAGSHSFSAQKGTFQYMSPEQIQMKEVTPASDIFALGVTLYETLTGRKPFLGQTVDETMEAILNRIPPPVSELNPAIPYAISRVVHKSLAKQPIHRFSSAREFSETLAKAFRHEPIFDAFNLRDRLQRVRATIKSDDLPFASELLSELESEGHLDPEIALVHSQIELAMTKKRIDHLLAAARARIEQDEIPLGLEKLRELLDLAPENPDALALKAMAEKKRSETQAGKWITLAGTHINNCDFASARYAAQEALKCRPGHSRAIELLRQVDTLEVDAKRVREQKEQLYATAVKAYQNGEIDSALSRLVRLFSVVRSHPEGAVPDRDALYASFYNEVSSERDSICLRVEEAQRLLLDENFAQALSICSEQLLKYPNNGTFQALKIQIEDAERQKISADLATTSRNADAEPDLERRANMWREAAERYPNEVQFAQHLKVACERRDLVGSIVAKAHQFREMAQYNEELNQWEMLRNIHPRYPGLAFELEQCRKKRDAQVRNEDRLHAVEDIVSLMEARQFARALEQSRSALDDYPGDAQLIGLEKASQEGQERSLECSRLLREGEAEAAADNRTTAIFLLMQAQRLDPRNSTVQDVLVNVLIEQARNALDSDLGAAEQLHQQASALNPDHRSVRSLGTEISNAIRHKYLGECLTEARSLLALGDARKSFERIQEGIRRYPDEARLQQFYESLCRQNPLLRELKPELNIQGNSQYRPQCDHDPKTQDSLTPLACQAGQGPSATVAQCSSSAEEPGATRPDSRDLDSLLIPKNPYPDRVTNIAIDHAGDNQESPRETLDEPVTHGTEYSASPAGSARRFSLVMGALCGAALVLVAGAVLLPRFLAKPASRSTPPGTAHTVHLTASPEDSEFSISGIKHAGGDFILPASGTVEVEVSHIGYQNRTVRLNGAERNLTVALSRFPVRITVTTGANSGYLQVDGDKVADLVDGSIDGVDLPANGERHTLALVVNGQSITSLEFESKPGQRPALSAIKNPAGLDKMIVVSSLGQTATVYGEEQLKDASIDGKQVKLSKSGIDVSLSPARQSELTYRYDGETGTMTLEATDRPSLFLRSVKASAELMITANVDKAGLTANGSAVRRSTRGWRISTPGTYTFVLTADNYKAQSWTATLKPRETRREDHLLVPNATQPPMATLMISGGTPGALVDLDAASVGELDENGSARFASILSGGRHNIQFHKEGFCSTREAEVIASPPAELQVDGMKLDECGSITLRLGAESATVRAFPTEVAGAKWVELPPGKRTYLSAGAYQLAIESDSGKSYSTTVKLEAGHNVDFSPQFTPLQRCQLANRSEVTGSGDWFKPRNGANFVYLSAACSDVNLLFERPKGHFLGKRSVELEIEVAGGLGRVVWELDGDRISRKSIAQHALDQHESKIRGLMAGNSDHYAVHVHLEGQSVLITNGNGAVLDQYVPNDPALHDLTGARLGIRTSAPFKFSSPSM